MEGNARWLSVFFKTYKERLKGDSEEWGQRRGKELKITIYLQMVKSLNIKIGNPDRFFKKR